MVIDEAAFEQYLVKCSVDNLEVTWLWEFALQALCIGDHFRDIPCALNIKGNPKV